MSTEGMIASVIMLLVGVIWLAWPLLRRKFAPTAESLAQQKQREILLTTYERTLSAIRDLDEDHLTGKLAQADYEAERAVWTEQGVALLQALETSGGRKSPKKSKTPHAGQPQAAAETVDANAALDDAIEQAIASYIKSTH